MNSPFNGRFVDLMVNGELKTYKFVSCNLYWSKNDRSLEYDIRVFAEIGTLIKSKKVTVLSYFEISNRLNNSLLLIFFD